MSLAPEIANTLRLRLMRGSHLGHVKPGARLPSVRELAREFGVDHRTIIAAYRTLEAEGLVRMRPRSGIYFDPSTSTSERADLARSARWALDVLVGAIARGTSVPHLATELAKYSSSVPFRVACVECNDDQASALVSELESDFGVKATGFNVDELMADDERTMTLLARFDLIVTTPFHAGVVQRFAQRVGVAWIAVTYRTDLFADIARRLTSTPVHFVLTDERFGAKLTRIFESSPGAEQLHLHALCRADLGAIPRDEPTYLSFTARRQLAGHPILARAVPETRTCSLEFARELLTFIVHANAARAMETRC
ncbi:MAG: winged helix-turn-helix transcriptional regulator [Gemmatimonadaceae bacterium]|nr:winged helix-turn-helix transcriptional regulator [Gemmatimonadaceae bacterium]